MLIRTRTSHASSVLAPSRHGLRVARRAQKRLLHAIPGILSSPAHPARQRIQPPVMRIEQCRQPFAGVTLDRSDRPLERDDLPGHDSPDGRGMECWPARLAVRSSGFEVQVQGSGSGRGSGSRPESRVRAES